MTPEERLARASHQLRLIHVDPDIGSEWKDRIRALLEKADQRPTGAAAEVLTIECTNVCDAIALWPQRQ